MSSTDTPEQREERKVVALEKIAVALAKVQAEITPIRMAAQSIASKK